MWGRILERLLKPLSHKHLPKVKRPLIKVSMDSTKDTFHTQGSVRFFFLMLDWHSRERFQSHDNWISEKWLSPPSYLFVTIAPTLSWVPFLSQELYKYHLDLRILQIRVRQTYIPISALPLPSCRISGVWINLLKSQLLCLYNSDNYKTCFR